MAPSVLPVKNAMVATSQYIGDASVRGKANLNGSWHLNQSNKPDACQTLSAVTTASGGLDDGRVRRKGWRRASIAPPPGEQPAHGRGVGARDVKRRSRPMQFCHERWAMRVAAGRDPKPAISSSTQERHPAALVSWATYRQLTPVQIRTPASPDCEALMRLLMTCRLVPIGGSSSRSNWPHGAPHAITAACWEAV
jgi:hypothetical protein